MALQKYYPFKINSDLPDRRSLIMSDYIQKYAGDIFLKELENLVILIF